MPFVTMPVNCAKDTKADALIGQTQSGYTAFVLSSYRPYSPLYIFTKERTLVNPAELAGACAFFYDEEESRDDMMFDQMRILKERGFLENR